MLLFLGFVSSGNFLLLLYSVMGGGHKRVVAIESKSFDFAIVGKEGYLQITEHGRGRRFSLVLPEQVARWLLKAWSRF